MRCTAQQQQENREAILAAARRLFKESGYAAVGIDAIARSAGLTSGALYSQYPSKQVLFEAVLEAELLDFPRRWLGRAAQSAPDWWQQLVAGYLGKRHLNNAAGGCVLPSLSVDAARGGEATQQIYEDALLEAVDALAQVIPGASDLTPRETVWSMLALLAGAIMLARATRTKAVAAEILEACRTLALQVSATQPPQGAA
jgi:TetR/AcrR family transcriptional repressor of nem operon